MLVVHPREQFLGVPLVAGGGVTGLLPVTKPVGLVDQENDEWLLSAPADHAAVALEKSTWIREPRCPADRSGLLCCPVTEPFGCPTHGGVRSDAMKSPTSRVDGRLGLVVRAQVHAATSRERDFLDP